MRFADRIDTYLKGWIRGDSSLLLGQTADNYFFDDPNRGKIARADFEAYVAEIKAEAIGFRGDRQFDNFEDLTEIVTKEEGDGTVTVWFWWAIPGTPIKGSSLVKVGQAGVLSEIICYYGKTAYGYGNTTD